MRIGRKTADLGYERVYDLRRQRFGQLEEEDEGVLSPLYRRLLLLGVVQKRRLLIDVAPGHR